jgi:hypothetical protein
MAVQQLGTNRLNAINSTESTPGPGTAQGQPIVIPVTLKMGQQSDGMGHDRPRLSTFPHIVAVWV